MGLKCSLGGQSVMVAVFIFAGHYTQMIYALSTTIPVDKLIRKSNGGRRYGEGGRSLPGRFIRAGRSFLTARQ